MDPRMTSLTAGWFPEIVGVKIAHYSGHDWEPCRRTVQEAEEAGIPVMGIQASLQCLKQITDDYQTKADRFRLNGSY